MDNLHLVLIYYFCVLFYVIGMYSESSFHVESIYLFRMLCMFAWSMMLVKMGFAVCIFVSQRKQPQCLY